MRKLVKSQKQDKLNQFPSQATEFAKESYEEFNAHPLKTQNVEGTPKF